MSWRFVVICVTRVLSIAWKRIFWKCNFLIKGVDRKKKLHEQAYLKTPAAASRSHIEDYPRLGESFVCGHHIYVVGGSRHYLKGRPVGGCGLKVPIHIGERILFVNFWQSTLLIKKLHFCGERFCWQGAASILFVFSHLWSWRLNADTKPARLSSMFL